MPLTKRAVSPVDVSKGQIPREVNREELQYVANSTLANLIRQLSSLSKHAEHIFGEIYHDAMKLDHKSNTLQQRIDRLKAKVIQLDSCNEQASLDELQMRKPFKSSMLVDQHTLDRITLPTALAEVYSRCDRPPNLDALNPYRESDAVSALSLYTNPSFFFDLWRMEMLKDCNDNRRRVKSPVGQGGKSPKKKEFELNNRT
uniref:Wiskott-Aldrich syndrome protein family member n=1 Tax=Heterorhabditis bacteriophora TaxID=37862 RepID=A0A1I7XHG0_HETBA